MKPRVRLIWLGSGPPPAWPLGAATTVAPTPAAVAAHVEAEAPRCDSDAWLFWAAHLGPPDVARVAAAVGRPGDVWHAGLRLGTGGQPTLIDFVAPTWPLNCDPDVDLEATSWRLSLKACAVRTAVLRVMGAVRSTFESLDGAALEMGHRYVMGGVVTRHVPALLGPETASATSAPVVPLSDQLRFVRLRFGRKWFRWALLRAVASGTVGARNDFLAAARRVGGSPAMEAMPELYPRPKPASVSQAGRVTVLIPTIDRYPYLRTVLRQLGEQTVPPLEIIVIDQTSLLKRPEGFLDEFRHLPLIYLHQAEPGQCTSRNSGLQRARGDFILFLDDDDEIPATLISDHLAALAEPGIDVSCGVAHEVGAGELPAEFRRARVSDVFPTNNTMVRREVLMRSGLFDLAYDRRKRADGDLGMRVYLSGALMLLDPHIAVLHHHAPQGGLRTHGARVITYAQSRMSLKHRHLPSDSEVYFGLRYFRPHQVDEMLWIRAIGTFTGSDGAPLHRALKALAGAAYLPDTLRHLQVARRAGERLLQEYPQIPALTEGAC